MYRQDLDFIKEPFAIFENRGREEYHWHTNGQEILWVVSGEAEVLLVLWQQASTTL